MKIVPCFVVPMEFLESGRMKEMDLDTIRVYLAFLHSIAKASAVKCVPIPFEFFDTTIHTEDGEDITITPQSVVEMEVPEEFLN